MTLADPDPRAREHCAKLWQSQRASRLQTCATAEELLTSSKLDGLIVASPTACHAHDARLVLEAGLPLYLEKPIAANLEEALAVAALDHGRASMGFNYRFHPLHVRARRIVQSGGLGSVRSAFSEFTFTPRELPAWKHHRSTGGGVLLDLGSHHLDLLCHTLGESPTAVHTATITSKQTEADTAKLDLRFASGVRASCDFSFCGHYERDRIQWVGEYYGSRLNVDRYAPASFPILPPWRWINFQLERYRSPWKEASFARCLRAWTDAITGSGPFPSPLADGLHAMRIIDAAERSAAASGATITL